MINTKTFRTLTCGLYLITSKEGDRGVGCVANTLLQVTSSPAQVSVALNKKNHTTSAIQASGVFAATVLDESATMDLIGGFGFRTSAEVDKFEDVEHAIDEDGVPYVTEHAAATLSARVVNTIDVGSHLIFIGEVTRAEVGGTEAPMSYAYYHKVKGGKTPPKASSYNGGDQNEPEVTKPAFPEDAATSTWKCSVCGYELTIDGTELPEDFTCPLCGMGRDKFTRIG